MARRTYSFTEFFSSDRKLSIQFLTSSRKETKWRAERCKFENRPYRIFNRITNEVVEG